MNEKSHIIAKIYGYVVCLVAIIVALISVSSLIGAVYNAKDPLHSNSSFYGPVGPSDLSSFESYKISRLGNQTTLKDSAPTYTPSDADLHKAYDSDRQNAIDSAKLQASRTITTDVILLIVALLLFWRHWLWVTEKK